MKFSNLLLTLALPVSLLGQPALLTAQDDKADDKAEAAAVRAFKKAFRPKAKALELKGMDNVPLTHPRYLEALDQRDRQLERWKLAVQKLRGFGSEAVAKAAANGWLQIEKEVVPLWLKRDKLEKRVKRDYEKLQEMAGGKALLPGQPSPPKVKAAQQVWLLLTRRSSQLRRDITDLGTLQEELRLVVAEMKKPSGLTWMLRSVVGNKKQPLVLKVEAIRSASALGEVMLGEMTTALAKASKPDELAALLFGIGILGEKARGSAPNIIELMQHQDEGVREKAALALQNMKVPASIKPMIDLLDREQGQARKRIAAALEILTAQQFGINATAWQRWFASEGADYAAGKKELGMGKPSNRDEYNKKNYYYYGIPQDGKSLIYIIDCSGSMVVDKDKPQWQDPQQQRRPVPAGKGQTSRSQACKDELIKALGALSSSKRFNIIWYNHAATLYKKKMQAGTPKNIKEAQDFVRGLPADSSTNIYDALKLAFTLTGRGSYDKSYGVEFDTIFLLTDGKPTLQGLGDDDPMRIIEGARKWNSLKRVVIHTIGIGKKGIDDEFMQMLADENGGKYRKDDGDDKGKDK